MALPLKEKYKNKGGGEVECGVGGGGCAGATVTEIGWKLKETLTWN